MFVAEVAPAVRYTHDVESVFCNVIAG
jgi:hypothetical protein